MKLTVGKHSIDLSRPVVMTIINATPDSFYEGSRTPRADDVARRAERAVADGAAILDVGGYSSRPGADDVTPDEELRRVTLALETIRRRCPDTPVSIDTFRSEVAEGAIERFGPCIVNDITAGTADPAIAAVAARNGVPLIAMHMRGTPQTMQTMTRYDDLTGEVLAYFVEKNFRLLGEMHRLGELGYPVLAGISRKSMIYKTLDTTPDDALAGTTALHWECLRQGASILRVHDTREAAQIVALYERYEQSNDR